LAGKIAAACAGGKVHGGFNIIIIAGKYGCGRNHIYFIALSPRRIFVSGDSQFRRMNIHVRSRLPRRQRAYSVIDDVDAEIIHVTVAATGSVLLHEHTSCKCAASHFRTHRRAALCANLLCRQRSKCMCLLCGVACEPTICAQLLVLWHSEHGFMTIAFVNFTALCASLEQALRQNICQFNPNGSLLVLQIVSRLPRLITQYQCNNRSIQHTVKMFCLHYTKLRIC
jgi:hypothetical protein